MKNDGKSSQIGNSDVASPLADHPLHLGYLWPRVPGKLEMVEMEVKMEVEMDAPILPFTYTGTLAPLYK